MTTLEEQLLQADLMTTEEEDDQELVRFLEGLLEEKNKQTVLNCFTNPFHPMLVKWEIGQSLLFCACPCLDNNDRSSTPRTCFNCSHYIICEPSEEKHYIVCSKQTSLLFSFDQARHMKYLLVPCPSQALCREVTESDISNLIDTKNTQNLLGLTTSPIKQHSKFIS